VNEPARVTLVGATVADIKGVPTVELAQRTTANALAVFRL
jgi:Tat protein secretion system quality control protein TatD with DNase activity